MKCDQCDQEATVHEVTIRGGKKIEKHLCERCARKQGIAVQPNVPINELIQKYVLAQSAPAAGGVPAKVSTCGSCGMSYAEFRQHGLLGCQECYKVFEGQLGPLLERAHEGGTHHVGKVPRRALAVSRGRGGAPEGVLGGAEERAERLMTLNRQLEEAVRTEQYERAAQLRDEIKKMSELGPAPAPTPRIGRRARRSEDNPEAKA